MDLNEILDAMPKTDASQEFLQYVRGLPPTGEGVGCHPKLYRAALLAKAAKLSEELATEIIESLVDDSARPLGPREVPDTVARAYNSEPQPRRYCVARADGAKLRAELYARADNVLSGVPPADHLASGCDLPQSPREQFVQFLSTLYRPEECIYAGRAAGRPSRIPTVAEYLSNPSIPGPYLIPNPFTGKPALKKACAKDKPEYSLRCDNAIASHRFLVCEIDAIDGFKLPLHDQLRLWIGAMDLGVVVAAITWSGGKSAHALVSMPCADAEDWQDRALGGLFYPYLVPMGVDSSCGNVSRLSRSPGYVADGRAQPLLYLNRSFQL